MVSVDGKEVVVPSFAIIGQMSSGKGTYAGALKEGLERAFGIEVYRVPSFSAKIADVARDLFGAENEADGKPNRTLLQDIGSKMREIDPAVWAKYLIRDIKSKGKLPFVAEGFRHPSELQAFREGFADLIVIRVDASESQRMEAYKRTYGQYPAKHQLEHPSEKAVADMPADLSLHNAFYRAELTRQVEEIVEAVRNEKLEELKGR
jgi:dephospho-CoA kinase